MKLINNSTNPLAHGEYKLPKGGKNEIPDEIAKEWLKIPGVEKYIAPEDVTKAQKQAEAKAKEEIGKLTDELKAAKAEIEKLKAENQKLAEAEAKAKEEDKALDKAANKSNSTK